MATGGFITSALACSTTKIALGVASTDWEGPACHMVNKSISAHTSPRESPLPHKKWKSMQRSCSVEVLADQCDQPVKTLTLGRFESHKVVRRIQSHQPQHMYGSDGELRDHYAHKPKESLFDFWKTHKNKSHRSPLHHPKNSEALIALLRHHDANAKDENGDAPIHSIVKHKRGKRLDVLLTLLIYSDVIVNLPAANGNTALHFAVMEGDELLIKVLLSFGAKVNALNHLDLTPVDIALQSNQEKLISLLVSAGGTSGDIATNYFQLPRLMSFQDSIKYPELNENEEDSDDADMPDGAVESNYKANGPHQFKLIDFEGGNTPYSLHELLQHHVNNRLELSGSFSASTDEAFAITVQQRELLKYKKTQKEQKEFKVKGGSRILCLDGGGIKGLVEIEILMQIEEATGRRITELFDWIVGTSTGGILALGLVYGKKSLRELQQLYFKIKNSVFANDRAGFAYNTEALEKLIKEEFGTDMVMEDVLFPRVMVSAVSKKTTQPELRFFNNCFGDEFTLQPVWKAARATSAAPMFFKEFENYVDGGVLANNPCEYALTAIQNHYRGKRDTLDIALVVSVGSGIYPEEELGKTDAQEFLFFGKHWFKMKDSLKKRAHNLITLLMTALLESESIAENCRSRLIEQGIPFYRFNPHLDDVIPAGETDTEKLLNMILKARTETIGQQMDELVQMFHLIAEMTRKLKARKKCEAKMAKFYA